MGGSGRGGYQKQVSVHSELALLDEDSETKAENTLDAAKRKNLPAWIR